MKALARALALAATLFVLGCQERTEQTDTGGVTLEVEFRDSVLQISVNTTTTVQIPTIEIDSIVTRPNGDTSRLMDVELNTMEVVFTRADTGTRVPPPYVFNLVGVVPVGGTLTYTNLPIATGDQLGRVPLTDLRFANGGFDRETGNSYIKVNATVRFFGKTIGGRDIASVPRTQTFEFVP
jgi:hypothetical protein